MENHRTSLTGQEGMSRRRSSVMFQGLTPWDTSKRSKRRGSRFAGSVSEAESRQTAALRMENNYRLEPERGQHFRYKQVEAAILEVLESSLCSCHYQPDQCPVLCKQLSSQIKHSIKELGYTRHKIVCHVILGQHKDQGFQVASRALWDVTKDDYACVEYSSNDVFAVATVHGLYYE